MTIYIKIPSKSPFDIDAFKARYLELTNEHIQNNPPQNEQETHYLVGSSKLTQKVANQLSVEFPLVSNSKNIPDSWVDKSE